LDGVADIDESAGATNGANRDADMTGTPRQPASLARSVIEASRDGTQLKNNQGHGFFSALRTLRVIGQGRATIKDCLVCQVC